MTEIFKTPLHIAIEKDSIEFVRLLLSNPKIDINIEEVDGIQIFFINKITNERF